MSALLKIIHLVASNPKPEAILALLADIYGQNVGRFAATLMLIYDEEDVAEMIATTNPSPAIPLNAKFDLNNFPGSDAWRYATAPLLIGNINEGEVLDPAARQVLSSIGVVSGAWIPLIAGGHTLGLLLLTWQHIKTFTQEESTEFAAIGTVVAQMLNNMLTQAQLVKNTMRLQLLEAIKRALAGAKTDFDLVNALHLIDNLRDGRSSLMFVHHQDGKPHMLEMRVQRGADGSDRGLEGLPSAFFPFDLFPGLGQFADSPEQILFFQNMLTDPRTKDTQEAQFFAKMGIVSMLAVPLISETEGLLGIFSTSWPEERIFSAEFRQSIEDIREYLTALVSVRRSQIDQESQRVALELARQSDLVKTHYLSALSHDLRTPLASIDLAFGLLIKSGQLDDKLLSFVQIGVNSYRLMLAMIEGILDYMRLVVKREPVRKDERVEIHSATLLVVDSIRLQAEKEGINIELDIDSVGELIALMDSKGWQKVLNNLLTNALKYTPKGGTITLRIYVDNEDLHLEVIDTGIGISPDIIEKVFDGFVQGDKPVRKMSGSLGLGLAVVKTIIGEWGGQITVTSIKGQGANFMAVIPLTREGVA